MSTGKPDLGDPDPPTMASVNLMPATPPEVRKITSPPRKLSSSSKECNPTFAKPNAPAKVEHERKRLSLAFRVTARKTSFNATTFLKGFLDALQLTDDEATLSTIHGQESAALSSSADIPTEDEGAKLAVEEIIQDLTAKGTTVTGMIYVLTRYGIGHLKGETSPLMQWLKKEGIWINKNPFGTTKLRVPGFITGVIPKPWLAEDVAASLRGHVAKHDSSLPPLTVLMGRLHAKAGSVPIYEVQTTEAVYPKVLAALAKAFPTVKANRMSFIERSDWIANKNDPKGAAVCNDIIRSQRNMEGNYRLLAVNNVKSVEGKVNTQGGQPPFGLEEWLYSITTGKGESLFSEAFASPTRSQLILKVHRSVATDAMRWCKQGAAEIARVLLPNDFESVFRDPALANKQAQECPHWKPKAFRSALAGFRPDPSLSQSSSPTTPRKRTPTVAIVFSDDVAFPDPQWSPRRHSVAEATAATPKTTNSKKTRKSSVSWAQRLSHGRDSETPSLDSLASAISRLTPESQDSEWPTITSELLTYTRNQDLRHRQEMQEARETRDNLHAQMAALQRQMAALSQQGHQPGSAGPLTATTEGSASGMDIERRTSQSRSQPKTSLSPPLKTSKVVATDGWGDDSDNDTIVACDKDMGTNLEWIGRTRSKRGGSTRPVENDRSADPEFAPVHRSRRSKSKRGSAATIQPPIPPDVGLQNRFNVLALEDEDSDTHTVSTLTDSGKGLTSHLSMEVETQTP